MSAKRESMLAVEFCGESECRDVVWWFCNKVSLGLVCGLALQTQV